MTPFAQTCLRIAASGILCAAYGCGGTSPDYKPAKSLPVAPAQAEHEHEHGAGPHHGGLVEIGEEEFHAEIVLDDKAHSLKVYLLGPDAKSDASTAAKELVIATESGTSFTLVPAAGSPEGQHQAFELVDEKAVHELAEAGFLHGTLQVTIGDKPYTAGIDVHFDGDRDHAHAGAAKP